MKFEGEAVLRCTNCWVEGPHQLLYLSDRLRASRCAHCGTTRTYSRRLYSEYVRDLTVRTARFPFRVTRNTLRKPTSLLTFPLKAARKPFGLLREMSVVTTFERSYRKAQGAGRV